MILHRTCAVLLFALTSLSVAQAETAKPDPSPAEIQDIIKKFTQKETEFSAAREIYTYRQTSKLEETVPPGGAYAMVEEVTFDDRNRRVAHVTHAPVTSLQNIVMTSEDEQDLRNTMPFVFTNADVDQYDVKYIGREKVDELTTYVFSVKPKALTKDKKRYFEGQIWVDDQDLQIVKTYGKGLSYQGRNDDQQFPKFTTYREQIDDKFWFPTYTYADDTLNFKDGQSQRIKVVVKYDHYKKYEFKTQSTITFGDVGGASPSTPNAPANPPARPKQ